MRARLRSAAKLAVVLAALPLVAYPDVELVSQPSTSWSDANAPRRGRFLVASRRIVGPFFHRSVVLLLEYGPAGAVGLIVNRPTALTVRELLPEIEEMRERTEPAHFGGPVEPNRMMVLIQARAQPPDSQKVVGEVYASRSLDPLRALARSAGSALRFRAYVGYAGWAPGQLEAELARGDWYVDSADPAAIFDMPPEEVWPKFIRRNSGVHTRLRNGGRTDAVALGSWR